MKRLSKLIAFLAALVCIGPALAADDQDDRGYLQAFLEDNLSDVGRDIRIIGFSGAFSSNATVDQITVADDVGIWLTFNKVDLNWTRSSLLRGAINISKLSAEEIIIDRRPQPIGGVPAPEATGFSLPDIPVSIEIGQIIAGRVELAEPLFGEAAVVQLLGAANLSGGNGAASLKIDRIDGQQGVLEMEGAYVASSGQLDLNLSVNEAMNGIAANLLELPDRPSVDLKIEGSGPLSDFTARIGLKTDGQDRLSGKVTVQDKPSSDVTSDDAQMTQQYFSAALSGDITPIFIPEYRAFFGQDVALVVSGQRLPGGALELDQLALDTDALDLKGSLSLADDGWPQRFALTGRIDGPSQQPVLLPLSGEKIHLQSADLKLEYDADKGDGWQAMLFVQKFDREDIAIETVSLSASGDLTRRGASDIGSADGQIKLAAKGIAPKSTELARAIGPVLAGHLNFDWQQEAPLHLSDLDLSGTDYRLTGNLMADDLKAGINIWTQSDLILQANDLSQFSALADRPLTGKVAVNVSGRANLLGGGFDLTLLGDGTGLSIGETHFDPLIAGASKVELIAKRDEAGTRIDRLKITTDQASAMLSADLRTARSSGVFDIKIKDTSVVDHSLSGPAALIGNVNQHGDDWTVSADFSGPGGVEVALQGSAPVVRGTPGVIKAVIEAKAASVAPYSQLAGRAISGSLSAKLLGEYDPSSDAFQADITARGKDLRPGVPALNELTRGSSRLSARIHRNAVNVVMLDALSVVTPKLKLDAAGTASDGRHNVSFKANLDDLGVMVDDVHGPASVQGTATLSGDNWQIAIDAHGPGGTNATVNGSVKADASRAGLNIRGSAPLALANRLIKPRLLTGDAQFDLGLNGPLTLNSLSGNVQTTNARLTLPTFRQALQIDNAIATLSGGSAEFQVGASVVTGGQIDAAGRVALAAPYRADIEMAINRVALTDGNLFSTILDGSATMRGPLQQGATLRADLSLDQTEIRIADVPASSVPILEKLRHINEPDMVHQTRSFAGLILPAKTQPSSSQRPYPIDIVVRAPNKLFVRGRGLDAELGGQLRLTGTSANIVPIGQFDLVRGRLDILGKRLNLSEGRVRLQGGFDPYLDFKAVSDAQLTQIYINVVGRVSAPEVTFTSNPELPQDEVLAQLLFGRKITEISPLQALKLAAAVRTLAGKGGDGIIGNLRNSFGLDDLDVTTDENGEATLKVGKYISDNIYTDVAVGSGGDTQVNLNLSISPSVTARGSVNAEGKSSIGVFFEKDY